MPVWQLRIVSNIVLLKVRGSTARTAGKTVYDDQRIRLDRHEDGGRVVGYVLHYRSSTTTSGITVPRVVQVGQGAALFFSGLREAARLDRTMTLLYEDRSIRLNGFSVDAKPCIDYLLLVRYSQRERKE